MEVMSSSHPFKSDCGPYILQGRQRTRNLMVSAPSAKSNCALIFSKFNCSIEDDWALWTLTVDLPCVCHCKRGFTFQTVARVLRHDWRHAAAATYNSLSLFSGPVHQSGGTKFSGWYLFTLCPCWCVLAKWRRTGLSPSRGRAARPLGTWWITWGCVHLCVHEPRKYICE